MLNQELKKTALNIHEKAKNRYNETYETTIKLCQALYDERKESLVLIRSIETLVSSIAAEYYRINKAERGVLILSAG